MNGLATVLKKNGIAVGSGVAVLLLLVLGIAGWLAQGGEEAPAVERPPVQVRADPLPPTEEIGGETFRTLVLCWPSDDPEGPFCPPSTLREFSCRDTDPGCTTGEAWNAFREEVTSELCRTVVGISEQTLTRSATDGGTTAALKRRTRISRITCGAPS